MMPHFFRAIAITSFYGKCAWALLKPLAPFIFPSPYKGDSNIRGGLFQGSEKL